MIATGIVVLRQFTSLIATDNKTVLTNNTADMKNYQWFCV